MRGSKRIWTTCVAVLFLGGGTYVLVHAATTRAPATDAAPTSGAERVAGLWQPGYGAPAPEVSSSAPPRWARLAAPTRLTTPSGRVVDVVPGVAAPRAPVPLVTALHAMCISAEENCAYLGPLVAGRGTLVCPTGNASCSDGSADWAPGAAVRAAYVREATAWAEQVLEEGSDPRRGDVVFGSSRGAYVARDLVYDGTEGRWSGLVLVGAVIALDPGRLRRAGIHRVLLAAPDFDDAARTMRLSQATLCASGVPARFVSLGPHHHGMTDDSPRILAASMDWVMGVEPTDECRPAGRR